MEFALSYTEAVFEENRAKVTCARIAECRRTLFFALQITVIVDDEDDNAPVFSSNSYEGHIAERSLPGTEVTMTNHVNARDPDENAKVMFTLQGDGSHLFRIDSKTGRIYFIGNSSTLLDREDTALYRMKIVAGEGRKCKITDY